MHRHCNESVHRKKHYTRGNNTIPYKLARIVTFESLKCKYSFATKHIVYDEIRLVAMREVSPPFGEEHRGLEQDVSFPANKHLLILGKCYAVHINASSL